jgi:hypothetical protein
MRKSEMDLPFRSLDPPEPNIIGRCVFCEKDIYQCEVEDTVLIDGLLAHFECLPDEEEYVPEE